MFKATSRALSEEISRKIMNPEILDIASQQKNFVKKYIESPEFSNKLLSIIENKDYSCQAVYALCQDILNTIDKKHNSHNWLYKVYQFHSALLLKPL